YATAVGKRAYEYTEKQQGYFTWAVVEGLKGGAAKEGGEITLARLVRYVQETVPKRIAIDLGTAKEQRPFAVIEGYRADDLVIAVADPSQAAPVSRVSERAPFNPAEIELSFWDSIKNSTDPEDFQSYLRKYPNGQFAEIARRRINANGGGNKTSSFPSSPAFFTLRAAVRADAVNNGWTNSGLVVRKGQRLRITGSGRVSLGNGRFSTPAGLPTVADNEKLMRTEPTGALIAVIGDDNDDFILVGTRRDFVAQRDGVLFLGVNEGRLTDNTGTFDVVIEAEAGASR
ncbi:MAG TPA: hypothetical protein VJ124_24270, partial [Pyrinomonadaceae bacterium]|nr:hypothetical protein [Pyrinomonadaceae bacterium]